MIESVEMKLPHRTLLFSTLIFYGATLMVPHKIVLFILCSLYFFVLWRLFHNFRHAFMALYLTLVPIIVGKLFVIDLISAQQLGIAGRTFGISADIIVSIGDMVVALMAVILIAESVRGAISSRRNRIIELLLFLYPALSIVATLAGSARPDISILHSLFTIRPLILYYFFSSYPTLPMMSALVILGSSLFFELGIVLGQVFRGGSIGLVIEPLVNYVVVDLSRDAGGILRYAGTYMHANALAHGLLIPLFIALPAVFYRFGKKDVLLFTSFFSGIVVMVLTMSRSAWLSAAVAFAVFYVVMKFVWNLPLSLAVTLKKTQRIVILLAVFGLGVIMLPRLISTLYSGGKYGSLETRMMLLKEYTKDIIPNLYFGVGLEMDVYIQYLRSEWYGSWNIDAPNRSVVLYFPEPVHNGFLRLLIEVGLVGALPYYLIVVSLFTWVVMHLRGAKTRVARLFGLSLVCAYCAAVVNGFMQPILPDISLLTALSMIYLSDTV